MNLREISSSVSNSLSDRISSVMQSDFLQSLENFLSNGGKDIKMIETATVDRIENDFAVCELSDKSFLNIPLSKFNFDISESDIVKLNLTYENGKISEVSVISKDDNEQQIRQKLIQDKFQSLRKKS